MYVHNITFIHKGNFYNVKIGRVVSLAWDMFWLLMVVEQQRGWLKKWFRQAESLPKV